MFEALKKYAQFSGRATRKEYIWTVLLSPILYSFLFIIITNISNVITSTSDNNDANIIFALIFGIILMVATLMFAIVNIAVKVRRFHDIDNSGWFCLFLLIPIINIVFLLFLIFKKGTLGANRFGDDPLQEVT